VASLSAAVDGTVNNGTTGKPQAGATVALYRLGGANGMEFVSQTKTDAAGKFTLNSEVEGPSLLQTYHGAVTYSHMLSPGAPSSGLQLEVFDASKQPGDAKVVQHMVLFEPGAGQLLITESYIYLNNGKVTYNDPDGGTLKFYLPPAAKGIVDVKATAPKGMPLTRKAEKTRQPNVYKIDFPIKPGETRIDLTYLTPFTENGTYEGKVLYPGGGPTRIVVPQGVSIKSAELQPLGEEPRTKAAIYDLKGTSFKVELAGNGSLRGGQQRESAGDDTGSSGPAIQQIMPQTFQGVDPQAGLLEKIMAVKWILLLFFAILTLGFILMYRAQAPATVKGANERGSRR
jgi:hypothetical protein